MGFLQSKIGNRKSPISSKPGLILLVGLLAALVCLLFAGGPAQVPAAGFDLPAPVPSSKLEVEGGVPELALALNDEKVEAAPPRPEASLRASGVSLEEPAPNPPSLPPPLPEPAPALEVPRAAGPEKIESHKTNEQPGETEMAANGKKLTVQIVLWGWLLANAQPAEAQQNKPEPGKTDPGEAATRLDKIERQLGDLHTGLKGLKELLEGVTKQLETYDLALRVQKNARDLAALREEVDRLQKELTKAQASLGRDRTAEPRKAMSPPEVLPPPGGRVATAQGQVELVNEWLTPISVWMDDLLYSLRPGERRVITKPAGALNYEVTGAGWGLIQPRRTTTVASGETLTIRIVPR